MKTFYIHTYGCRMNIVDSECIVTIMQKSGYVYTSDMVCADIIILNSCSVREDGHTAIYNQLDKIATFERQPLVILVGCFAMLIEKELIKRYTQLKLVVTTHHYRQLPILCSKIEKHKIESGFFQANAAYDLFEDILPTRVFESTNRAAINIVKGCNQNCTYCIEPRTRESQHCRSLTSILNEAHDIVKQGYAEITLVGHLIDCYRWTDDLGKEYDFADVLRIIAEQCPKQRIRFLSSHPNYFSEETIDVICACPNIAHLVHLPIQSASNTVLNRMNRGYTKEQFISLYQSLRQRVPDIQIVTDIMVGFCSETESEFNETVEFLDTYPFEDINAFMFSMRLGTYAALHYMDDVPPEIKHQRYEIVKQYKKGLI